MSLRFITWNVQHGSAAYVRTPNDKHIVVDLGARTYDGSSFNPLLYLKSHWGVSQLDSVIISHPHIDHIEDILNFDALDPRCLTRPKHLTEADLWAGNRNASEETKQIIWKYIEVTNRYTHPIFPQDDPMLPENNGGASIKIFTPTDSPTSNLNNHSVVTVITYEGVKILSPGDNESTSWSELLNRSDFRDAISGTHVLVAPHHGRESGFYRDLFDYIEPVITIISDGRFSDTSATARYSDVSKGWTVKRRKGSNQVRKCVTTRNDGPIDVIISRASSGAPTLSVTID